MAKGQNEASKTNVKKVRQQNQAAEQGQGTEEFASETDAQEVRKQNQKAQQKKSQQ
ncbi:gamma-type small acid-soluble spore protein [Bacillus piscicola]|uniref:gamma-type small acid-soluble spore protein n=1 Tax=Bacillus piscicola TaxID=1632684 RepID=UPI001F09946B|nr:gamma-type small acid-soluble spore protein [Bacillus piscicola]